MTTQPLVLDGKTFAATNDGLWAGSVVKATLVEVDGVRTFRVLDAKMDGDRFEVVASETSPGTFVGTWSYPKNVNSGHVELRMHGAPPAFAFVGSYVENGTKGRWVFELVVEEDTDA